MRSPAPIHLASDHLDITVLPTGAALSRVAFAQRPENLVLGFADPQYHQDIPVYAGHILGPIANRITAGRIALNGTEHQMPLNEAGRTTLHSGPQGLHARDWDVTEHSARHVALALSLQDGDIGLPGNRQITAEYAVAQDTLTLTLTARTDRPTPMNLAHHPYWRLSAAPLCDHLLQLPATHYLPTDAHSLPTGQIAPVQGTAFDFTRAKPVPLTPALDVNYCLATTDHAEPALCATLTAPDGTRLEMATTATGLQVYGGAFLPNLPAVLQGQRNLQPYGGIALEAQGWPDAPHHPHFPQITLAPDTLWQQVTTYSLTAPF